MESSISAVSRSAPRRGRSWLLWGALIIALAAGTAAVPRLGYASLALALAVIAWRWPEAALQSAVFGILAVRPTLDLFSVRTLETSIFAINPAVLFGLLMLLLGGVLGLQRLIQGKRIWPDRQLLLAHVWLFVAYLIMAGAGARWYGALGANEGIRELLRVASIVAAFLLLLWWVDEDPHAWRRGWIYLGLGTLLPIYFALQQLITGEGFIEAGRVRLQGTFSHPNSFGQYLVPFILAALGSALPARGLNRLWRLGVGAGLAVLLVLTLSRTAILVLGTAVVAMPLLQSQRLGWRGLLRGFGIVVVFGLVAWLFAGNFIVKRFQGVSLGPEAFQEVLAGRSENSFTWRLINWGVLVLVGMEHPIVGHGAGMTTQLNPVVNQDTGQPFNAHDDFVRFFFEGGVLGLAAYVLYGAMLCLWALRRARAAPRKRAGVSYGIVAALLAMIFLSGGTTELSLHTANLYALYGMLGMLEVGRES